MREPDLKGAMGIKRIHHVGILITDIDEAVASYADLLDNNPAKIVDVARAGVRLRSAMIPVGQSSSTFIQLIQPLEGPGVAELKDGGDGTLYEVAFEVDDIARATSAARKAGEAPTDIAGIEFDGPFLTASSGNLYFYLQPSSKRGTRLELIEVAR